MLSKKAVTEFFDFLSYSRTTVSTGIAYQPYTLVQSKEGVSELPAEILALLKIAVTAAEG